MSRRLALAGTVDDTPTPDWVLWKPDGLALPLQKIQTPKLLAHDPVALTGGFLKPSAVLNGDMTARIINQASLLKHSGGQGDRSSGCAQHLSEKFMSERHPVRRSWQVSSHRESLSPMVCRRLQAALCAL